MSDPTGLRFGVDERMTVRVGDDGVLIEAAGSAGNPGRVQLSPSDALMLLDILTAEADRLRAAADAASPLPVRFDFR